MAVRDIEAFIRQKGTQYDPNLDVSAGSPFDTQVVQPVVRRLGTDPFTVDLSTFLSDRMLQAYPYLANQEEDGITDLLIKPATLLWDPIIREIIRVRQNLSLSDPSIMTTEEADALGANFFSIRKQGQYARGVARILFSSPQGVSLSPANFFTSKGGLHFFPSQAQSIRLEEMLLNVTTDSLYYFDVNVVSESPGIGYSIGPNELVSVANIPSATRVTNLRRFGFGEDEENAQSFISRTQQELGEKSLVTLRGVAAQLVNNFPEIDRLNVVGSNDPEMQRDIIEGGGLGPIITGGRLGTTVSDGEGQAASRRFQTSEVNFLTIFGHDGSVSGWTITVFDAFGSNSIVQDLHVRNVVDADELEVEEQVMVVGLQNLRWCLRKHELTISKIPGGILFPNTANGTIVIHDDEVHIGGQYDTYVRGSDFVASSFVIGNVTDDVPLAKGYQAQATATTMRLFDLTYAAVSADPDMIQALDNAVRFGYTLQVEDLPAAGSYRVIGWSYDAGVVAITTRPAPIGGATAINMHWRIFDVINIDLLSPRETRIDGIDLITLQNSDIVSVPTGTDFNSAGVSIGDVLNILSGQLAGNYTVKSIISPNQLQLDSFLKETRANLSYTIYRPNSSGGMQMPLVRVTSLELLDSSHQPLGTKVPYARPVDVQSRSFQNPARGIKHDLREAILGLVSQPWPFTYAGGATLEVYVHGPGAHTITLIAPSSLAAVIADLNTKLQAAFGLVEMVVPVGIDRLGFRPFGTAGYVAVIGGSARLGLFGNTELRTTGDVRDPTEVDAHGGWAALQPPIDLELGLDVLQVLDGFDIGFYPTPFTLGYANGAWPAAAPSAALLIGELIAGGPPVKTFAPAILRRVQLGARSIGSARVYFMEPTTFEVDPYTIFTLAGTTTLGPLSFHPDPTLDYQKLPSLPSNKALKDGVVPSGASVFNSASQDFVQSGIQPGDKLVITNMLIGGSIALTDPIPNLAGTTLVFAIGDGPDRTVVFIRDDPTLSAVNKEVSRSGMLDQINAVAGESLAVLTSTNTLNLDTSKSLVVRSVGTANQWLLGTRAGTVDSFVTADQTNESPISGTYHITVVAPTALTVEETFGSSAPYAYPLTTQIFQVFRSGIQRCVSTQMAQNTTDAGLYYFDVELLSEGCGDQWNITANQQLTPARYRSDGYYLTTDDTNFTFSPLEHPRMVLSRSILDSGVDDDPSNATQLTSTNIQVNYDRAQIVSDVQSFLLTETERVICANPLSRHLIPHFIRFDLSYIGGSREDLVKGDIDTYIKQLAPVDTLDASDIQKKVTDRGATYVKNPLDLVAIVYNEDRTVWVQRSNDQLSTGRLSSFISDAVTVTRKLGVQ